MSDALRGTSARPPIVVLAGPTASGKSSLAMALAASCGGEIVNADSVQVYQGFDIGSAKPSVAERARVAHHLLDLVDPTTLSGTVPGENQEDDTPPEERVANAATEVPASARAGYHVAQFVADADAAIADVLSRGRMPIVVGGTGLYLRSLVHGLAPAAPADPLVRATLEAAARQDGLVALHARLMAVDPAAASRIHHNDPVRIVRALEVYQLTGQPLSAHQAAHGLQEDRVCAFGGALQWDAAALARRIDTRVVEMLDGGLLDEVAALLARGVGWDVQPMQAIGYRQAVEVVLDRVALDGLRDRISQATRKYAKRQRTWFRTQMALTPLEATTVLPGAAGFEAWRDAVAAAWSMAFAVYEREGTR